MSHVFEKIHKIKKKSWIHLLQCPFLIHIYSEPAKSLATDTNTVSDGCRVDTVTASDSNYSNTRWDWDYPARLPADTARSIEQRGVGHAKRRCDNSVAGSEQRNARQDDES